MVLKIHPGIGVARVGDSADYFIGPETVDSPSPPTGGYRDELGKIRRQASRFRVYDGDTHIVGGGGTAITWTVNLNGGSASISGIGATELLIVAGVTIAELHTDPEGNLLVVSSQVSDTNSGCNQGRVEATLAPGGSAVSSWVVIIPPDFAPGNSPPLPHHLLILDYLVAQHVIDVPPAAALLSFRRDIYPAIRGRTTHSPSDILGLTTPAERDAALHSLSSFDAGKAGAYLAAVLQHYHDGTFIDDWATPTPITPAELDRGPLAFVDGSCSSWGWELAWLPIAGANPFAAGDNLRLSPTMPAPGGVDPHGWLGDVAACVGEWVTVTGAPLTFGFDWHIRGFMVQSGSSVVYEDWWPVVDSVTPVLDFGNVEQGSIVARNIEIEARNFFVAAPIEFSSLPAHIEVLAMVTTTGEVAEMGGTISLPVLFRAATDDPLGSTPPATIQMTIDGTPYSIAVVANIVAPVTTQVAFVLDCSYSMEETQGGETKFQGLKDAMGVLINVARQGDGFAIAPFSDDAVLPGRVAVPFGAAADDTVRLQTQGFVDALETIDNTSIGDGILLGRELLSDAASSFARSALVVITDGKENRAKFLDDPDVQAALDLHTFAIGIGTASNVNADKLSEIAGRYHGYLMLTNTTLSSANQHILIKYLLQILAGATQHEVVLDPIGYVHPGTSVSLPFAVSEAEFRLDAVIVSDDARELTLGLIGPGGTYADFSALAAEPGVEIVRRGRTAAARVPVPLIRLDGTTWGPGTWQLVLSNRARVDALDNRAFVNYGKRIEYAAVVSARSSLRFTAHVEQLPVPTPRIAFEANVSYAGVPHAGEASVIAYVETPQGAAIEVPLARTRSGQFLGNFEALTPGVYTTRLRARGFSARGHRFARELTLTPFRSAGPVCCESPRRPTCATEKLELLCDKFGKLCRRVSRRRRRGC